MLRQNCRGVTPATAEVQHFPALPGRIGIDELGPMLTKAMGEQVLKMDKFIK